ncbi:MAG: zinc ABC transporter substrate-binding protein [Kitasatospora sp.]|jgi:zinc/manganese transport system substrate-binding protein|nr:zinc ABC transporter substrate-binding protein [Kitasatospora sp.]
MPLPARALAAALSFIAVLAGTACSSVTASDPAGTITAVGAENEYASVIGQIGGKYVHATSIESNPNTAPHSFEASPSIAHVVSTAQLIVQNGVGYDSYMNKIESAAPSSARKVIDVQKLLGLPDSTPNPHLWYDPKTMPAVARTIATDLSALQPAHAAYFRVNLRAFDRSLQPWYQALARFKAAYPGTPVAVTEPVSDYLLRAAGARILTPFRFQADVMNGVDPAPQDISLQDSFFTGHKVKVFLYNEQVTDSLTQSFLDAAHRNDIPVVAVYETMPTPGFTYQSWMLAETRALQKAVADHTSTQKLRP